MTEFWDSAQRELYFTLPQIVDISPLFFCQIIYSGVVAVILAGKFKVFHVIRDCRLPVSTELLTSHNGVTFRDIGLWKYSEVRMAKQISPFVFSI